MDRAGDDRLACRAAVGSQAVVADTQVEVVDILGTLAVGRQVAVADKTQVEVVGSVQEEVVDT